MEGTTEDKPQILFNGVSKDIHDVAEKSGYPNSGVWCKNIDELVGVIGHGVIDAITPENALRVVEEMETMGIVEKVMKGDTFMGWNIHANENATSEEARRRIRNK